MSILMVAIMIVTMRMWMIVRTVVMVVPMLMRMIMRVGMVMLIVFVFFRMFHLPLRFGNVRRRRAYFYLMNRSNESFRSLMASSKSPSFTARTMQCFR